VTHAEAVALIRPAVAPGEAWAELGAGEGTFTCALAELVAPHGEREQPRQDASSARPDRSVAPRGEREVAPHGAVWASDRDPEAVRALRRLRVPGGARLEVARADFQDAIDLPPVDGILMANALHFVAEPEPVLRRLVHRLPTGGKLLLVEYDRTRANPWVPYPIPLARFRKLTAAVGLSKPEEVGRRPSRYHGEMYAALVRRP
jgi:SAM-dependent methyltransferase